MSLVLVVGAAGGVGSAVAMLLLERGYSVLATVLSEAESAAVRASAPAIDEILIADLSNADQVRRSLTEMLSRRRAKLAGVIVCAAVSPPGPLEIIPLDVLRRTLEVNAVANVAVYQACMPHLRETKGRVLLMSSNAGKAAYPMLGAYVGSKHALEGFCDVMRQEASHWGIDVVLFEPGAIRTGMLSGTIAKLQADLAALDPEQRALYGPQLAQLLSITRAASAGGLEPRNVAESIVGALESPLPDTRYVLGEDSVQLLKARGLLSDRDMDKMFKEFYSASGAAGTEGPDPAK